MGPPASSRSEAPRDRGLVCDDDSRILESISGFLGESFEVETAGRAADAIQRIMGARYQALVLDCRAGASRRSAHRWSLSSVAREQQRRRRRARARQKVWQTRGRRALGYLIALSVAGWMLIRLRFVPAHLVSR